MCAYSAVDYIH